MAETEPTDPERESTGPETEPTDPERESTGPETEPTEPEAESEPEPGSVEDDPASSDDRDDAHLRDVDPGAGCTEIWEHLSETRDD